MPKIYEESITVKVYKLIKSDAQPSQILADDLVEAMTSVVEKLLGDSSLVVEVEKVNVNGLQ